MTIDIKICLKMFIFCAFFGNGLATVIFSTMNAQFSTIGLWLIFSPTFCYVTSLLGIFSLLFPHYIKCDENRMISTNKYVRLSTYLLFILNTGASMTYDLLNVENINIGVWLSFSYTWNYIFGILGMLLVSPPYDIESYSQI